MNAILYLGLAYWPRWLAWLSAPEIDYRPVPLFLYRDGKNGISTAFFDAEKH